MYKITVYNDELYKKTISFFRKSFKENNRILYLKGKDSDLERISDEYMARGNFWCAIDSRGEVVGSVGIRPLENSYEVRRFFVRKKASNNGLGQQLLEKLIEYAIDNKIGVLKAGTKEDGHSAHHIFEKFGFVHTKRYAQSTADIFYKLELTYSYIYTFELNKLKNRFFHSLILNPTENIPIYAPEFYDEYFEGLYVSERFKDVNDKVIFAGRNEYIKFFERIKKEWAELLNSYDVDLKTLSGLNAHLILFLCIMHGNEKVMLLPEICGGHFATTQILENLGANVIHMIADIEDKCVDVENTKKLIEKERPSYIFVDRSEGLVYEDFTWLSEYDFSYKIFDASQYLTQILTREYKNPFDMGFDMIVSTLHKNYPGPQKGIIAVKHNDMVWKSYLANAKTYISNTHPMAIAKSLLPLVDLERFKRYSMLNVKCSRLLEASLKEKGVPVVNRDSELTPTLHIWILCSTKEESYSYFLKLEELNILTNYRLLPYNLGYGLRVGVSAAVRMGLKQEHISELSDIMADAYLNPITPKLRKRTERLINNIITTGELSDRL